MLENGSIAEVSESGARLWRDGWRQAMDVGLGGIICAGTYGTGASRDGRHIVVACQGGLVAVIHARIHALVVVA
jgi:hypothetical protein